MRLRSRIILVTLIPAIFIMAIVAYLPGFNFSVFQYDGAIGNLVFHSICIPLLFYLYQTKYFHLTVRSFILDGIMVGYCYGLMVRMLILLLANKPMQFVFVRWAYEFPDAFSKIWLIGNVIGCGIIGFLLTRSFGKKEKDFTRVSTNARLRNGNSQN